MDVESGWPGIDHRQREEDIQWLREKDWITWHAQLPNEQVLTLMQESHLGLLPTWQDTYGYSVLEMQANGCPVLTTSIRSLPEINRDEVGWRVQHATNVWGEWSVIPTTRESFISQELVNSLKAQLRRIFSNPEEMESKGRMAVDRIEREHNPNRHAMRLNEIYQEMFNKK
jgi:glycosyltransferase involved in cell wall biosynthesis